MPRPGDLTDPLPVPVTSRPGGRPRIVVVGAGFGGLTLARALQRVPVDVTVVDANNFHTFQPLLYQVATAGLGADDVAYPVRGVFRRLPSVDVRLGRVVGVDLAGRRLTLDDGATLGYDQLVLAAGAVTADLGVAGVAEHGRGLKSLADALALRNHVLGCFEAADRAARDGRAPPDGLLTFVVAGGGPTGVEVAGALVELFDKVLAREFHHVDVGRARVVLVEAAGELLGAFHPRLARRALDVLRRRGVEVRLGTAIEAVEADRVRLGDGEVLTAATLVWSAGVRANPLGAALGVPLGRGGRVPVGADLRLAGHPEVAVIGDLAAVTDPAAVGAGLLPQLAPVAMQQARWLARSIAASLVGGRPPAPFRYRDKGIMATIGRAEAVAQLPYGLRFAGFPGWLAWLGLHLIMLIGFRNRANVLVNWAWNYLTYDRGARLILATGAEAAGQA